jgi:hypothetical protein
MPFGIYKCNEKYIFKWFSEPSISLGGNISQVKSLVEKTGFVLLLLLGHHLGNLHVNSVNKFKYVVNQMLTN